MIRKIAKTAFFMTGILVLAGFGGCGSKEAQTMATPTPVIITATPTPKSKVSDTPMPVLTVTLTPAPAEAEEKEKVSVKTNEDYEEMFKQIKLSESIKPLMNNNPLMVQRFGADPYAIVYDGRVYIYMTGDKPRFDSDGKPVENDFSNIVDINVISSADLVNWTDHGSIHAASAYGAAYWARNSWAPAVAYKNIDGQDKFFLYFANNANGIVVLEADTPVGPFKDILNKPLITRKTPNCDTVTWLFDPAVLMDDDGQAYIYFGGGVPEGKAENPGTARVARLGSDMISLDGDPVTIENVPYLFEDSGINKINGKYFYSYCSNFSVTAESKKKYGFDQGQIIVMKSDDPMGPFELCGTVLKAPGTYFGRYGNNHHCLFEFKDKWYITYHARLLEKALGLDGQYRSTNIDELSIAEDGTPLLTRGTLEGAKAVAVLDPYAEVPAVTMSHSSGIDTAPYGKTEKKSGSGTMLVSDMHDGSFVGVSNVDFGDGGAKTITVKLRGSGNGAIKVALDLPGSGGIAYVPVTAPGEEIAEASIELLSAPEGVHRVFFVFAGEDYEVLSWQFKK